MMKLIKLALCLLLLGLVLANIEPARADEYVGINTMSRHFTRDNEKYCEVNWGLFYEKHWQNAWGVQTGLYRNSYCNRDDRVGHSFYAVGTYQPWKFGDATFGVFAGAATGYKKGNLVGIVGAIASAPITQDSRFQVIVNVGVIALQFKTRID